MSPHRGSLNLEFYQSLSEKREGEREKERNEGRLRREGEKDEYMRESQLCWDQFRVGGRGAPPQQLHGPPLTGGAMLTVVSLSRATPRRHLFETWRTYGEKQTHFLRVSHARSL